MNSHAEHSPTTGEDKDTGRHTYSRWPWIRCSTCSYFLFCLFQEKIATIAGKFGSDKRRQNTQTPFLGRQYSNSDKLCSSSPTRGNPSERVCLFSQGAFTLCVWAKHRSQVKSRSVSCLLNMKEPWSAAQATFAFQIYANRNRFVTALIDELLWL